VLFVFLSYKKVRSSDIFAFHAFHLKITYTYYKSYIILLYCFHIILNSDLGKQIIGGVSNEVGQDQNKTASVLSMALPVLMGAMKRNASTPEGAEGLNNALSNKHNGSILDNLGSLFGGGVDEEVKKDGDGILRHVLGDRRQNVEKAISKQSGVDASSIGNILKVAAPILMGVLGKQKQQQNVQSSGGIGDLLGGLLGGLFGGK